MPSGGPDCDVLGNGSTLFVDLSASYQVNERLRFTLESQSFADQHGRLYSDSQQQDSLYDVHNGRTISVGAGYRF